MCNVCRTCICLDITRLYEEQRQPYRGSAWPAWPKNDKSGPHCGGREVLTKFAQQFVSTVTAPPLIGCVLHDHGDGKYALWCSLECTGSWIMVIALTPVAGKVSQVQSLFLRYCAAFKSPEHFACIHPEHLLYLELTTQLVTLRVHTGQVTL